jgi:hypothetical protein
MTNGGNKTGQVVEIFPGTFWKRYCRHYTNPGINNLFYGNTTLHKCAEPNHP